MSEDYPRVVFTRRVDRKKGDLFFGPFFAGTARRILKLVADQFKLRSCDLDIVEGKNALTRPCLYYDMHQCLGPCVVGLTTTPEYREMVDDVVLFLTGKSRELQERLRQRMYRAAETESFEVATYYRDLIRTVERIQAEQQVASAEDEDMDVWGLHEEGSDVAVQLFVIRSGAVVDRRELFWEKVEDYRPGYFLSEILQRYYQDNLFIPQEILIPFDVDDTELIDAWLTSQAGRKTHVRVPQRGRGVDRLELANRNARLAHESRFRKSTQDRLRCRRPAAGQDPQRRGWLGGARDPEDRVVRHLQHPGDRLRRRDGRPRQAGSSTRTSTASSTSRRSSARTTSGRWPRRWIAGIAVY